jgi:dihydrofolate synthase/folylpolyglutamate synthase
MQISNFAELEKFLERFTPNARRYVGSYNLDRMRELMPLLGSPQEKLKVIHVAGTSGKTSTSYFTAALLQTAGAQVGLSVSPHIFKVNERVQINHQPLAEDEFCQLFNEFISIPGVARLEPTYFELIVSFAFWVFTKKDCTHAVIEVGLGGLLDGTNIIENPEKVAVITDIGLDHTRILGDNVIDIAHQKAGIIKPHNHVFLLRQNTEVESIIKETCAVNHAILHEFDQAEIEPEYAFVSNLPLFQRRNWLLAHQVYSFVATRDGLQQLTTNELTKTQTIYIPARQQTLKIGDKTVILDGAHNPQKLSALLSSLKQQYSHKTFAIMASFSEHKQETLLESLRLLHELSNSIIATTFNIGQDFPHKPLRPKELASACKTAGFTSVSAVSNPGEAFQKLLRQKQDTLLVTGSFYLIASLEAELREFIHD